jgi:hypothetical protein
MAKDNIFTLCDFNGSSFEKRSRALKSGGTSKARYTVSIRSEPLLINCDPKALGAGPALAIAEHLKQRIAGITDTAAPATVKARLSAQKAVVQGEAWAAKRYSGGKLGTRAPARSDKLFNDSGRLIESIKVGATKDGYVINVAGNRFDPTTLNGGEAALFRIMQRLKELVPEFGDPKLLMDSLPIYKAIKQTQKDMMRLATERTKALQKELFDETIGKLLRLIA